MDDRTVMASIGIMALLITFAWVSNNDYKQSYSTMPEAIKALERGRSIAGQ